MMFQSDNPGRAVPSADKVMRVLIADDNAEAAASLAVLLRHWGFEPIVVHDGMAALKMLEGAQAPGLAHLDWYMAALAGIEVCRRLRKKVDTPYTYVILVTGRGGKQDMLEGLNAGADDYLTKPVDPNELRARVNTGRRILNLQEQLLHTQKLLRQQATRDALTGVWNRAMILEILERELARSRREGQPVSILLADADHFKDINDTHGHLVGDRVLRHIAQRLSGVVRTYDSVGRYGGEEFLLVLPDTDADIALALAERLRHFVEEEPTATDDREVWASISIGVATPHSDETAEQLLQNADNALYAAKRSGRNRVVSAMSLLT